jgi:hypothetical protein
MVSCVMGFVCGTAVFLCTATALQAQGLVSAQAQGFEVRALLESLDPTTRDERSAAVEAVLRDAPCAVETLLLGLLHDGFLDGVNADPLRTYGPLDPAAARHFNSRQFGGSRFAGGPRPGVSVDSESARLELSDTIFTSPLLLDLNQDGIAGVPGGVVEPHRGLDFARVVVADINGDGFPEITEWVDGTDGLLVDPEDDSKVTVGAAGPVWTGSWSGRDLFGTAEGFRDGFQKLQTRDADGDGLIDGAELRGLFVWCDIDADGLIEAGELRTLESAGIRALELPMPGQTAGRFLGVQPGIAGALWDWWPSYGLAQKRLTEPVVPPREQSLTLQCRRLPPADLRMRQVPIDSEVGAARAALEAAGIDWGSLSLLAVSPEGSRFVLQDASVTVEEIQAGNGRILWSVMAQDNALRLLGIPLPVTSMQQVVFLDEDRVLVAGNNGAKLLRVDLANGERCVLLEPVAGQPGFRAGPRASRFQGLVYTEGYFHDALQRMSRSSIARYEESGGASMLVHAATLDALYASVASMFGSLRADLIVGPELAYFLVQQPGAAGHSLVAFRQGEFLLVDQAVLPGGIAASGDRVVYFRIGRESPLAVSKDLATGEQCSLDVGDYTYPYLEDQGRLAVLSRIDWANGRMDFLAAELSGGGGGGAGLSPPKLVPILRGVGIGALRVSEDGRSFVYLGASGLRPGSVPRSGGPQFLRGNANGTKLPADPLDAIDISDAIFVLNYLFLGGVAPSCLDAADANDDGNIDLSDGIKILRYLFGGGKLDSTLPAPWPEPGEDPTEDKLDCEVGV